nr:solute carrier family 22 member 5-like [Pseudochaenichthys georgianus]
MSLDLLRKSSMRTTTLIFCFVFFCSTTGYFGLSLNTAQLHANPYISCFISAAVEVPAYISSWLILHYLPRRPSLISSLLLGAMPLYLILLVPQMLRNTAIGTCTTVSRVGSSIAPFVIRLNTYILYLPYIILSTLAVVAAIATYFLPESFGKPLPETMTRMHKRERFIKRPCSGKETTIRLVHLQSPL